MKNILDKKIDAEIRRAFKGKKLVGLSIGILNNGQTTFYGYGETKKGNGQLPDEHTIFEIGSITKTFTGTLLACAVGDKKSNLNDPANKYLPDSIPLLEYKGTPITLVTLSNHTSGLPRKPSNLKSQDETIAFTNYDDSDLYCFYKNFKLPRKPGEKLEYSNLAVGTLGVILERIYGTRYDSLVVRLICDPLKMSDTRLAIAAGDSLRFAQGYRFDGKAISPRNLKEFAGAGGLRSTETGGFQSFIIIDPTTKIAVVVLLNMATNVDDAMDDIGVDIIKMLEKV